jgi:hypothetical protein
MWWARSGASMWRSTRRCQERGCGVASASSAEAVLRAVTVTLMTWPSVERSDKPGRDHALVNACLVAARGPENTTPREAMKLAAYGVQINR